MKVTTKYHLLYGISQYYKKKGYASSIDCYPVYEYVGCLLSWIVIIISQVENMVDLKLVKGILKISNVSLS